MFTVRDGQIVDTFVGLLEEDAIDGFVEKLVKKLNK